MKILAVSAVIIGLDQVTKTLIKNYLNLFDSVPVVENFFHCHPANALDQPTFNLAKVNTGVHGITKIVNNSYCVKVVSPADTIKGDFSQSQTKNMISERIPLFFLHIEVNSWCGIMPIFR